MELEHFRDGSKQLQPEPRADPRFWAARDEESDLWDLIHVSGEHRKDSRRGLFIPTFVKGVDDDKGREAGSLKRAYDEFLQLGTKSFLSDLGVDPQDWQQLLSELWVPVSELEGEGWEDVLNVSSGLEISRTEETRAELPVCEATLGERLGDGRLAGPRETVQPENALVCFIGQPTFDLPQYILPRSSQASLPFPGEVSSTSSVMHSVEKGEIR